jgi:hypothetical protein
MPLYRRFQHWGQLFQLLTVGYEFLFSHSFYFVTKRWCLASKKLVFMIKSPFESEQFVEFMEFLGFIDFQSRKNPALNELNKLY